MKSVDFGRYVLGGFASAAVLAGCGASQPTIGTAGAMPQSRAIASHAQRGGSWMLPDAKQHDLLYVSSEYKQVTVYSYPRGKLVGQLTGFDYPQGLCSDRSGNVFVADEVGEKIYEYAHGGATPIATLDDYPNAPISCAVDRTTGNLAISGAYYQEASIQVFPKGKAPAKTYEYPSSTNFAWCTYDDEGNLFTVQHYAYAGAGIITELPKGASQFVQISLDETFSAGHHGIQWDGQYLAVSNPSGSTKGPTPIYQVRVSGSSAQIVNTLELLSKPDRADRWGSEFWIQRGTIVYHTHTHKQMALWHYPTGGDPFRLIGLDGGLMPGVTVSTASRRNDSNVLKRL
jgi:hypothetical protein